MRAVAQRDPDLYDGSLRAMAEATPRATPDEVQRALVALVPVLEDIGYGMGTPLVGLVASMTDYAVDPVRVLPVLAHRAADAMERAARFEVGYRSRFGDVPDPSDLEQVPATMGRFATDAESALAVEAWFAGGDWVRALLYLSQRKEVRLAMPGRDRLLAAAGAVTQSVPAAHWLYPLLLVLDDEPLVVLHRASGRGYQVTISGIADNFQLHTLLAATLIGDAAHGFLDGEPPTDAMVASATEGEDLTPEGGIVGQFNLVDYAGKWIFNEGRPADIPALDGQRVIVLDPPPYPRTWNAGRAYPLMKPAITIDRMLDPEESAGWLSRVAAPAGG